MTREEEIKIAMKESVTETIYSSSCGFTRQAIDLLECAWVKGAEWADKTMLERVEQWLIKSNRGQTISSLHRFLEEE
jgi:hypothetical protein